jgi:hypothetical protein
MIGISGEGVLLEHLLKHAGNDGVINLLFLAAHPADQVMMTANPCDFVQRLAAASVC